MTFANSKNVTPNALQQTLLRNLQYLDLLLNFLIHEQDPCRLGVKDEVKLCSDASVKVNIIYYTILSL